MFDFAGFDAQPVLTLVFETPPPTEAEGFVIDRDGLAIPLIWQDSRRWYDLPKDYRRKRSDEFVAEMRRLAALPEPPLPVRGSALPRFTTQYAVDWGRKQGWQFVDRERYDHLNKRHHDLMLGLDVLFDPLDGSGMVGIQAAGRSERKKHYDRFMERGGIVKAVERRIRVLYHEYVRGNKNPVLEETWAQP